MVFMTYSAVMPIMYILGALHFVLAYICWKFLFVWYNRTSFGFDEVVPLFSVRLMKWGLFLHLVFNCFMLTNKRVLTPPNYTTDDYYRPLGEPADKFFNRRFDIFSNFSVVLVGILCCGVYAVWFWLCIPCYRCCLIRNRRDM
jgi:hypothetical protein